MAKKHVCCDCVHSILDKKDSPCVSDDGECWDCKQRNWQDESVCLGCTQGHAHGCRGWGERCGSFTRRPLWVKEFALIASIELLTLKKRRRSSIVHINGNVKKAGGKICLYVYSVILKYRVTLHVATILKGLKNDMLIILLFYLYYQMSWLVSVYILLVWIASWPREIGHEK